MNNRCPGVLVPRLFRVFLKASDNGKIIKARVTFADDAGNEESLTSVGTSAVVMGEYDGPRIKWSLR